MSASWDDFVDAFNGEGRAIFVKKEDWGRRDEGAIGQSRLHPGFLRVLRVSA